MRVISKPAILKFAEVHPDSLEPLLHWYRITKRATWTNVTDVRKDFGHADFVAGYTVFNIAGNKYRLISRIRYIAGIVYIHKILTHTEYAKANWRES